MKKYLISSLVLLLVCCRHTFNSKFIGKWTDGKFRHLTITADNKGYVVEDISGGDKTYCADLLKDELIVKLNKGTSTFNYIKGSDEILAGSVKYYRESAAK